ncbi:hypothetical protein [Scandinavium goeteborgense]|uniref:Lipoprotein n=1 Tax=Scandinavium goeteborgense TaxID=1851514 RepID=A0A4R6EE58_SCAGO|nr:hypothetical protein [Scandinavium goeteborgense]TDN56504.1 hypothetical protein EC847_1109 [Scandinavium goeteborgense]
MIKIVCTIAVAGFMLSSCSSSKSTTPDETQYQRVLAAAHDCAEEVREKTIALVAKGSPTRTRWTTANYVTTDATGKEHRRSVEYRTSTILDNGSEGSAWKKCMQDNDALVPELTFTHQP